MRPLDPARRIRRWHTYLVVWTAHRILGLSAGALLFVLSVTGSLLVMHHEIEHWRGGAYRTEAGNGETGTARASYNSLVEAAAAQAPAGYRLFRLMPAHHEDGTVKVMFLAPDSRTRWSALCDPHHGTVRWHGPDEALLTPWLLQLHMTLHLGPWGYAITGLVGGALCLLGLTGLYLHRYDIASLWRRIPLRFNRGWRVFLHDTHTWVGAISLYFLIVLGATGVAFAILILPGRLRPPPPPPPGFAVARLAPLEPIVEQARAVYPGQELLRLAFPAQPTAPLRLLFLDRRAPVWAKFSTVDFNAGTGELVGHRSGRDATTKEKWRAVIAPLHFGFYGATWVKVAYVAGGLAPALLAVTGTAIWWRRTRRLDERSRR